MTPSEAASKAAQEQFKVTRDKKQCVQCLTRLGFGIKRVMRMTFTSTGTVSRWARECRIEGDGKRRAQVRFYAMGEKRHESAKTIIAKRNRAAVDNEYLMLKSAIKSMKIASREMFLTDEIRKKQAAQKEFNKYNQDHAYRLKVRLRSRIRKVVKRGVVSERTMDIIDCSAAFLRAHLESKFKDGMNWDNMGEWHIDHIKPCALFDLSDINQVKECFHYSNLQPLWAEDNLAKSDTYDLE